MSIQFKKGDYDLKRRVKKKYQYLGSVRLSSRIKYNRYNFVTTVTSKAAQIPADSEAPVTFHHITARGSTKAFRIFVCTAADTVSSPLRRVFHGGGQ